MVVSPVLPTEKSIFELTGDGSVVTKSGSHLLMSRAANLGLEKTFDCDPNAKVVKISPDRRYIACLVKDGDTSFIEVIDVNDCKLCARFSPTKHFSIRDVVWSPDSESLVYFSNYGTFIGVFTMADKSVSLLAGPRIDDFGDPVCAFSPGGDHFVVVLPGNRLRTYSTRGSWTLVEEVRSDVDNVGVLWVNGSFVAAWGGSSGLLTIAAPTGRKFHRDRLTGSVRAAAESPTLRLFAAATLDSKVHIYDTISWKKVMVLEHGYSISAEGASSVSRENYNPPTSQTLTSNFIKRNFVGATGPTVFKEVKNICDSLKMKTHNRYWLKFGSRDSLLASYDPAVPSAVWIWDLFASRSLTAVIALRESTRCIRGLEWHPSEDHLAVSLEDRVVFWSHQDCSCDVPAFGLYLTTVGDECCRVRFTGWSRAGSTVIGAVTSLQFGIFVYLPPSRLPRSSEADDYVALMHGASCSQGGSNIMARCGWFKCRSLWIMASDFFYPNTGGVEAHIFNLSQCLILMGHKVVVITHKYKDRVGVRYMTNGLKVYYLPVRTFYNECVLPTMICSLPLVRYILVRERIDVVHGHSAFSTLAHEVMAIGGLLGLKTVFTDHSLFGFADSSAIVTNKFLEISLANVNHCICVSHIGKENTVMRARVNHCRVSVIPNAVDTSIFVPHPEVRSKDRIVVVVVSRLVYRKGIDLLAQVIADFCLKHPKVDFLVGGSGPKSELLEEVRRKLGLGSRLTLLGTLETAAQVCATLNRGHIFLNTSLTEAYCMAIVEAASCGLQVVSTRVGGIIEVLPHDLIYLTEPSVSSVIDGLERAISDFQRGTVIPPEECHARVAAMYNWRDVTRRTSHVYTTIEREPTASLGQHLRNYLKSGVWPFLLVVSLIYLILMVLNWVIPVDIIDIAKDYIPAKTRKEIGGNETANGPVKSPTIKRRAKWTK